MTKRVHPEGLAIFLHLRQFRRDIRAASGDERRAATHALRAHIAEMIDGTFEDIHEMVDTLEEACDCEGVEGKEWRESLVADLRDLVEERYPAWSLVSQFGDSSRHRRNSIMEQLRCASEADYPDLRPAIAWLKTASQP